VEISNMMSNTAKSFDVLTISLSVLHNYFNDPTKLFLNLYLIKFLEILQQNYPFRVSRKKMHIQDTTLTIG